MNKNAWLSSLIVFILISSIQPARMANAGEPSPAAQGAVPVTAAQAQADDWQTVDNGIEYKAFFLPDPNRVYVARMDRSYMTATLQSSLAQGRLVYGRESVSAQARRYNESATWYQTPDGSSSSWGYRQHVAVAINGSYVETLPPYMPLSGMISQSWYAKRFDETGGSGFSWGIDRVPFIGRCAVHIPEKQIVTLNGVTIQIDGVNTDRRADQLIIYTPQYDTNTGTGIGIKGQEILVQLEKPAMVYPPPRMIQGKIIAIYPAGSGSNLIPFDSVILSAQGTKRRNLINDAHAAVGDTVGISQEITSKDFNCLAPYPVSWTKTYTSITGNEDFIRDGQIVDFTNPGSVARNPRTAIAYNDAYIYFIVVDGRSSLSAGMTIHELAVFARDTLGATWAIAQDGGGSSTMVINGVVVNRPSDRCYRAYIPAVNGEATLAQAEGAPRSPYPAPYPACERLVANGMMMVEMEAPEFSTMYKEGDTLKTASAADMRLGPGPFFGVVGRIPSGAQVQVQHSPNGMDGVLAKDIHWWLVSYNGRTGWVSEGLLMRPNSQVQPQEYRIREYKNTDTQ